MDNWTREGILAFLRDHADELKGWGVTRLGLFGSYVRDEQRADSDVDLLITMDNYRYNRFVQIWNFLEDHLQRKVDLIPEDSLRAELRESVLAEVIYVEECCMVYHSRQHSRVT